MQAAESFSIALDRTDPVVVLVASGEVDASTVADLGAAIDAAITGHTRHVVIDATDISFIDSTGITALVAGQRRLNRGRRRLAIGAAKDTPTGRALAMSGLDRQLEVHGSTDAAVAALATAPLLGR
jgi:anti-sigma B factor antagonist